MCEVSAKTIKLYSSWNSSKFSIFQINNLISRTEQSFEYYKIIKKSGRKSQFCISHPSHLKKAENTSSSKSENSAKRSGTFFFCRIVVVTVTLINAVSMKLSDEFRNE